MIFGLKNIEVELAYLLNHDIDTPTSLIGKKMVPILQYQEQAPMPESLDIISFIDQLSLPKVITIATPNTSLQHWLNESRDYTYRLCMPRWVKAPLPEFATPDAQNYFINKKTETIGSFPSNIQKSVSLKEQANTHLKQLDNLIPGAQPINTNITLDDFHLFAQLKSLSIVDGLIYPDKVEEYRHYFSEITKYLLTITSLSHNDRS